MVGTLCIISFLTPTLLDELKMTYTSDATIQKIILAIQSGSDIPTGLTFYNDLQCYKERLFLGSSASDLKAQVLQQVHASPLRGHSGYLKSFQRLKKDFYWTGMVRDLKQFVRECDAYQRLKSETCLPTGLLQLLATPDRPWLDINVDFVEGLPKSQQKLVVFVVVDRFTKYVHFIPLAHPYTAAKVAHLLHGMPSTIVSDKDLVFTSKFWSELMKLQGITLAMSSSYHPQSDGQTEVVNKSLEHYLRAFAADRPHSWVDWLPLAEFWFNTNFHTSIKLIPFEALYGYSHPKVVEYVLGVTRVAAIDSYLQDRQQLFSLLKHNLNVAQERMTWFANKKRVDRSFEVGDQVYLRLQPYKQSPVQSKQFGNLAPHFYGPFQIVQKVGQVSYKLDLPKGSQIHPVFHVSNLKAKLGAYVIPRPALPVVSADQILAPKPVAVLDTRTHQLRSRLITQVLMHWQVESKDDATWESLFELQQKFLHLVGKVF